MSDISAGDKHEAKAPDNPERERNELLPLAEKSRGTPCEHA